MVDSRTFVRRSVFVGLVSLTTLLCGNASSQVIPRILNGVETNQFESVGIVGSMELGGYCSGTLITPRHVLTAAHCAELTVDDNDGTFIVDGTVYMTTRVYIHPDYDPDTLDNDIAIYELSEDVEGVEPSSIFRDVPMVGDLLTIVGFGGAGSGESGTDRSFGTKRVGTIMIDVVTDTLVSWEFDNEDESNTAPGDSGGPNFLEIDGEFVVASVTSGGSETDAGLGDIAFNTRVDAFQDWIDFTIDGGGVEEPAEDPTEEEPNEEPTEESSDEGGCHGGGHGGWIKDLFTQLDDYFMENYNQTFGNWLGGVLDDIFGDDSNDELVTEEPAAEQGEPAEGEISGPPTGGDLTEPAETSNRLRNRFPKRSRSGPFGRSKRSGKRRKLGFGS